LPSNGIEYVLAKSSNVRDHLYLKEAKAMISDSLFKWCHFEGQIIVDPRILSRVLAGTAVAERTTVQLGLDVPSMLRLIRLGDTSFDGQ
jgi:hypothetical protein